MCYERSESRRRGQEREEGRRFWEAFRRETAEPPAREPEIRLAGEEHEAERLAEPVER